MKEILFEEMPHLKQIEDEIDGLIKPNEEEEEDKNKLSSEKIIEKILKINNLISYLYILLSKALIEWEFIKDWSYNSNQGASLDKICSKIRELKDYIYIDIDRYSDIDRYGDLLNDIKLIVTDTKKLQFLYGSIYNKRKVVQKDFRNYKITDVIISLNKRDRERKLFNLLIYLDFVQNSIDNNLEDDIYIDLIWILENIEEIDTDNQLKLKYIKQFIRETVILNLFKISLVSDKKEFNYYSSEKNEFLKLNPEKEIKNTHYKDKYDVLKFISLWNWEVSDYKHNESKKNSLYFFIKAKEYKSVDKSEIKLKKLYKEYKKEIEQYKENIDKYKSLVLNLIYIWNSYLSFIVEKYQETWEEDLENEIEKTFNELNKLSKDFDNSHKNYFTYYKYSCFKNIEYGKKSLKAWIKDEDLEKILESCNENIEKAESVFFESINYNNYFEFEFEDCYLDIRFNNIKRTIYCHNLYSFPFLSNKKKILIENEYRKQNNFSLSRSYTNNIKNELNEYNEELNKFKDDFDKNKIEVISVIWIFTWIITFFIWTIQIFAIIENLLDAFFIAWIFLSWTSLLIGLIFLKPFTRWKDYIINNKWLQILFISIIILIGTFGIYILSDYLWFSNKTINWSKGEKIYEKLKLEIENYENKKDSITEKYEIENKNLELEKKQIKIDMEDRLEEIKVELEKQTEKSKKEIEDYESRKDSIIKKCEIENKNLELEKKQIKIDMEDKLEEIKIELERQTKKYKEIEDNAK